MKHIVVVALILTFMLPRVGLAQTTTDAATTATDAATSADSSGVTVNNSNKCCSIWDFLGVSDIFKLLGGILKLPIFQSILGLFSPLASMLGLGPGATSEAAGAAGGLNDKIAQQKKAAKAKVAAAKALGKEDCRQFPEIVPALLPYLDDVMEEVRYAGLQALKNKCGKRQGFCLTLRPYPVNNYLQECYGCQCNPKVVQKLNQMLLARDEYGCFKERSQRVRALASQMLEECLVQQAPPPDFAIDSSTRPGPKTPAVPDNQQQFGGPGFGEPSPYQPAPKPKRKWHFPKIKGAFGRLFGKKEKCEPADPMPFETMASEMLVEPNEALPTMPGHEEYHPGGVVPPPIHSTDGASTSGMIHSVRPVPLTPSAGHDSIQGMVPAGMESNDGLTGIPLESQGYQEQIPHAGVLENTSRPVVMELTEVDNPPRSAQPVQAKRRGLLSWLQRRRASGQNQVETPRAVSTMIDTTPEPPGSPLQHVESIDSTPMPSPPEPEPRRRGLFRWRGR